MQPSHLGPVTKSNPAMFSDSATFSNPSTLGDADDVTIRNQAKARRYIRTIVLRPLPTHLKVVPQQL
jgi:hypothetical protein